MTAGTGPAPVTVAVLGLGEAGSRIARDLAAAGARVRGFDPAAAAPPGIEPAADDAGACRGAALVLSLTTAGESEGALRQALPALGPGAVYADANTASAGPEAAAWPPPRGRPGCRSRTSPSWRRCHPAGCAPRCWPPARPRPPPPACSNRHGASVGVLPGPAGTAATRKLLRSVFYKGLAAAVVEALRAARAAGQEDWLREHIAAELAAADEATAQRLEHGSYQHAARRAHEMAAAGDLLEELGVPPRIARASQHWLEDLAAAGQPARAAGPAEPGG